MKNLLIFALAAVSTLGLWSGKTALSDEAKIEFEDQFESRSVDKRKWSLIKAPKVDIQREIVRSGSSALVSEGRFEALCELKFGRVHRELDPEDANCVKNEVRIAANHWITSEIPAWYGFSLRIGGDVPKSGSIRTVLAQWKERGGANPFFALRYDNGILHASVQDNRCRVLITAEDAAIDSILGQLAEADALSVGDEVKMFGLVESEQPNVGDLLQNFESNNVTDAICNRSDTEIQFKPVKELPSPLDQWVDFAVFLKRDRLNGRVEIWADGELRGVATGPIGSDYDVRYPSGDDTEQRGTPPKLFEKFGIYGDICSLKNEKLGDAKVAICRVGLMKAYYDNYRRGLSREDVDPWVRHPRPQNQ